MSEIETRLVGCFNAAFCDVTTEQVVGLVAEDYEPWDSLATVTLAGLVEEEFDTDVGPEEAQHFVSFASVLSFLQQANV